MTQKHTRPSSARAAKPGAIPGFDPVRVRERHDGWTPERQIGFIEALAECGCVDEAAQRVGMAAATAYRLRRRFDAQSFREAWDIALDYGVRRLSDAAFSRSIHGTAQPVFYKGEQIGERRQYNERLTMFLLRYRDPVRYGAWLDTCEARRSPDGAASVLHQALDRVAEDAYAEADGAGRQLRPPLAVMRHTSEEQLEQEAEKRRDAAKTAAFERWVRVQDEQRAAAKARAPRSPRAIPAGT